MKVVNNESFDELIFVGDYFDSPEFDISDIIDNFFKIVEYKKVNSDKVVLLLGNHDFHYLPSVTEFYSGFNPVVKPIVSSALHESINNGIIKACHGFDNFLVSHAGLTYTWCIKHGVKFDAPVEPVNDLLRYTPLAFKFQPGPRMDRTGNEVNQGPIWVRPNSLMLDGISGFSQIVGHTTQPTVMDYGEIILIDSPGKYLVINNGIKTVKSV